MLVAVISILILASIILIFYSFFVQQKNRVVLPYRRIPQPHTNTPNPLFAALKPLSTFLLSRLDKGGAFNSNLLNIKSKLNAEQFFSLKIALAIAASLAVFFFIDTKPVWVIVSLFFGFLIPDIWLNSRLRAHREAVQRVLPETIDLLSLCIGAGLDFTGAVRWITEKAKPNPMIDELKAVLGEIQVGKPRLTALKDMAKRLNIIDVSSFVSNLVLSERMGTPVEEVFSILSDDIRMRRAQRGERQALKAPIKILMPLIFCILPIIMIVIAGPVLINFLQGDIMSQVGIK